MLSADDVIRLLELQPHPVEGGHFRETWRSRDTVPGFNLPAHEADRSVGTAIYYLLTGEAVSEMHRLPGDEVFHFYLGDPVEMLQLHPDGSHRIVTLGTDLAAGQVPQLTVHGGIWQGSHRLAGPHGYSLLGATMAPGFDYHDYAGGDRAALTARWPGAHELIAKLTPRG